MEEIIRFRHNVMGINSMSSFAQIKSGMNHGSKNVFFVRMLGSNAGMVHEISNMDRTLQEQMNKGTAFYKRCDKLPQMIPPNETAYYVDCYESWVKSAKNEIIIKCNACKDVSFRKLLAEACKSIEQLFAETRPNANESILKNFMVKVLFWFDAIFNTKDYNWSEGLNSKLVAVNVSKVQEYLFWYAVTLTGSDVLLLLPESDLSLTPDLEKLSLKVSLGDFSKVEIPEYIVTAVPETQSLSNNTPVLTGGNHQQNGTQRQTQPRPKVTIPRHPGRETRVETNAQPQSPVFVSGTGSVPGVVGSASGVRREKSYEELAQMASSVVMIAVHDARGDIISTGSGIMIGRNGYILTNNHVANGGRFYSVKIEDEEKVYQTDVVVKYNPLLDLAVIRIDRQLDPLPVYKGPDKLVRGQRVVAIGSPLGLFNSVSDGIISGFRMIDSVDMIQFTAPISHGSSGGAVLNMYGEVIGISTAGIDSGQNINLAMGYECINTFIQGFTS